MFGLSDSVVVVVVVVRFYFCFYVFSGIEGYVDCHGCCVTTLIIFEYSSSVFEVTEDSICMFGKI